MLEKAASFVLLKIASLSAAMVASLLAPGSVFWKAHIGRCPLRATPQVTPWSLPPMGASHRRGPGQGREVRHMRGGGVH